MEGKGPFRIYDPGGSEASGASYRQLVEENSVLRERMKGLKSLGHLLEESQQEASKLRQRVEELVRDNETLRSTTTSSASSLCVAPPVQVDSQAQETTPGPSAADPNQPADCPKGRAFQPPDCPTGHAFHPPDCPTGHAFHPPDCPTGRAFQPPDCPKGRAFQPPDCPTGHAFHPPDCPTGRAFQLPDCPSGRAFQPPDCPSGRVVQPESSEGSSEFEVVNVDEKGAHGEEKSGEVPPLPRETLGLASQLQRLESSFSLFSEDSNPNQLLAHLGRMAVEFNRLSSKVQKNEQRTSLLQTLCEQLRQENSELRKKMEEDLQYRNQDLEQLRQENQTLRKLVTGSDEPAGSPPQEVVKEDVVKLEPLGAKMEAAVTQQNSKGAEKGLAKPCDPEAYEKKIKLLEKQRKDVLEVNKQWDVQWNSMKQQFEQKITDLRQRLADSQKAVGELEAEREQRQRDYDKKLLLAKSKMENLQGEKEVLNTESGELRQKVRYLQDQLLPLSKQREYQEKEIQRLNRALEEALNLHPPSAAQQTQFGNHGDGSGGARRQELLTQIAVLKEQVKIFEEDFQKERSDRERMNEEKEDLRRQVDRLQGQMTNLTNQLHQTQSECQRERAERCKLERLHMHLKQGFPWQTSFPQPRGARAPPEATRPPPENTDAPAAGFGKRDRQNMDPGKH